MAAYRSTHNVVAFMVKVRLVENKLNKNDGNVMVANVISQ